ncbi:hypothetical protein KPL37_17425 [Clostridium frigoris]|uniref:Class IIb bacteriocin, lactobin A/cerein 7B family n=1 Tax=Clostridium frigoris TaxID=205327 RepID=A0ABS6BXZ6_9CLOT|nr:hypothetical protein [Clostridium frigoris]MBU3161490.1 hypothetical protein [Clostridium frigoris]
MELKYNNGLNELTFTELDEINGGDGGAFAVIMAAIGFGYAVTGTAHENPNAFITIM